MSAPAVDPLPTFTELQKLYDDGQYRIVLQKMTPILGLNGEAARAYDQVDLLMLRGEALLRIKQQQSAVTAFSEAVKASGEPIKSGKTVKPRKQEQIALARATVALVKRSVAFEYRPKPMSSADKPTPISLLDASKRQSAFELLLLDMKREVTPKASAAAAGKMLPPIMEAVEALVDFEAVEFVTEKSTREGNVMLEKLADQAESLMSAEATRLTGAAASLDRTAHTKYVVSAVDGNGNVTTYTGLRGLHPDESRDLKGMIDTLEKIVYTSREFQRLMDQDRGVKFKAVEEKVMAAGKEGYSTLHEKYQPR